MISLRKVADSKKMWQTSSVNTIKPLQTFVREQTPADRLLLLAVCFVVAAVSVFAVFDMFDIRLSGFGDGASALFRFLVVQIGLITAIAYLLFAVFVIILPAMLSWGGWISSLQPKVISRKLIIFSRVPSNEIRPPRFLSN
jgi:hypothetical protein